MPVLTLSLPDRACKLRPKSVTPYPPHTQRTSRSLPLHSHGLLFANCSVSPRPTLLFRIRTSDSFSPSSLVVLQTSAYSPLFLLGSFWVLCISAGEWGPAPDQCPRRGRTGAGQSRIALRVLQAMLLFAQLSAVFAFFTMPWHCWLLISLWSIISPRSFSAWGKQCFSSFIPVSHMRIKWLK